MNGVVPDESRQPKFGRSGGDVFAHGIWAGGSCFQKLIPTLRSQGHEVMAAQYGLDSLKGDVEATLRTVIRTDPILFHYERPSQDGLF